MGKGDKKTYRGKLLQGSFGITRPRKRKKSGGSFIALTVKEVAEVTPKASKKKVSADSAEIVKENEAVSSTAEAPVEAPVEATVKKAAVKTPAKPKTSAKKTTKESSADSTASE